MKLKTTAIKLKKISTIFLLQCFTIFSKNGHESKHGNGQLRKAYPLIWALTNHKILVEKSILICKSHCPSFITFRFYKLLIGGSKELHGRRIFF